MCGTGSQRVANRAMRSATLPAAEDHETSRFPDAMLPPVHGVSDRAGPIAPCVGGALDVAFRFFPQRRHPGVS